MYLRDKYLVLEVYIIGHHRCGQKRIHLVQHTQQKVDISIVVLNDHLSFLCSVDRNSKCTCHI